MTSEECRAAINSRAPAFAAVLHAWDQGVHDIVTVLAIHVVEKADILLLRDTSAVVEQLLAENDEDDTISLGFVEVVYSAARDGRLDESSVYRALGPAARSVWDDLLQWDRAHDLRKIAYTPLDIGRAPPETTFVRWLAKKQVWSEPGSPLAELSVRGQPARLVLTVRCLLDRVATNASEPLLPGTLLCYLAPWERKTPKGARLCDMVEAAV